MEVHSQSDKSFQVLRNFYRFDGKNLAYLINRLDPNKRKHRRLLREIVLKAHRGIEKIAALKKLDPARSKIDHDIVVDLALKKDGGPSLTAVGMLTWKKDRETLLAIAKDPYGDEKQRKAAISKFPCDDIPACNVLAKIAAAKNNIHPSVYQLVPMVAINHLSPDTYRLLLEQITKDPYYREECDGVYVAAALRLGIEVPDADARLWSACYPLYPASTFSRSLLF